MLLRRSSCRCRPQRRMPLWRQDHRDTRRSTGAPNIVAALAVPPTVAPIRREDCSARSSRTPIAANRVCELSASYGEMFGFVIAFSGRRLGGAPPGATGRVAPQAPARGVAEGARRSVASAIRCAPIPSAPQFPPRAARRATTAIDAQTSVRRTIASRLSIATGLPVANHAISTTSTAP